MNFAVFTFRMSSSTPTNASSASFLSMFLLQRQVEHEEYFLDFRKLFQRGFTSKEKLWMASNQFESRNMETDTVRWNGHSSTFLNCSMHARNGSIPLGKWLGHLSWKHFAITVHTTHCYHRQINGWDYVCYVLTRWMRTDEWLSDGNVCWEFQAFPLVCGKWFAQHGKWWTHVSEKYQFTSNVFSCAKGCATTMPKKFVGVMHCENASCNFGWKSARIGPNEWHCSIFQIEIDDTQLSIHKCDVFCANGGRYWHQLLWTFLPNKS